MPMIPSPEPGPMVACDFTGDIEGTHRPPGSEGPFFCRRCGATDHPEVNP